MGAVEGFHEQEAPFWDEVVPDRLQESSQGEYSGGIACARCPHLCVVSKFSSIEGRTTGGAPAQYRKALRHDMASDATSSVFRRKVLCWHGMRHHIGDMEQPHPHAEATYRVMPLDDGAFGVELVILDTHPTMVTGFSSQQTPSSIRSASVLPSVVSWSNTGSAGIVGETLRTEADECDK
jgi:hypothetical protein